VLFQRWPLDSLPERDELRLGLNVGWVKSGMLRYIRCRGLDKLERRQWVAIFFSKRTIKCIVAWRNFGNKMAAPMILHPQCLLSISRPLDR